ncbi:hypothetical protein HYPSUDRAFT_205308 [Hypholoma sublateritium FD-334 SS-4]|uniref:Uncharacterized protein n=1 Tax=Hypholoma sublateritium (strain FD-334 SS-4) TaxID=945553 RepID=A0A0D2M5K8_HYPSF|nr:hypothetical protein HYPSUDRAFT_205308 [Hypholoma sublateritium FD-334 SS-4]
MEARAAQCTSVDGKLVRTKLGAAFRAALESDFPSGFPAARARRLVSRAPLAFSFFLPARGSILFFLAAAPLKRRNRTDTVHGLLCVVSLYGVRVRNPTRSALAVKSIADSCIAARMPQVMFFVHDTVAPHVASRLRTSYTLFSPSRARLLAARSTEIRPFLHAW